MKKKLGKNRIVIFNLFITHIHYGNSILKKNTAFMKSITIFYKMIFLTLLQYMKVVLLRNRFLKIVWKQIFFKD